MSISDAGRAESFSTPCLVDKCLVTLISFPDCLPEKVWFSFWEGTTAISQGTKWPICHEQADLVLIITFSTPLLKMFKACNIHRHKLAHICYCFPSWIQTCKIMFQALWDAQKAYQRSERPTLFSKRSRGWIDWLGKHFPPILAQNENLHMDGKKYC